MYGVIEATDLPLETAEILAINLLYPPILGDI
jgi:hypothetical protein